MKTHNLGPFLGINNRLPDFALHTPENGDYLADAVDVDVDNAGLLRSRLGLVSAVEPMAGAHSLHLLTDTTGYLVRDSVLYAITLAPYAETLAKALTSDATMSYASMAGELYYSNGTDIGRLSSATSYPIGLPTPTAPALAAISGGALLAGHYQVSVSYARMSGAVLVEEGGVSSATTIERTTTGSIRVTLPGTADSATHVNIYLTAANGTTPQLLATVAASTATYDAVSLATGREASRRFEAPLPAGTLFAHNGMLCSFAGNAVYLGLPYRPGYSDAVAGYVPFPAAVSIAISAQTGYYVAADKTYWIPDAGQVSDVLPYGAVPGTAFTVPNAPTVGWFGAEGVVLADTSGSAKAVTADSVDLAPPASGFSVILESGGYQRVVSCGWCVNLETMAVTRYADWGLTSVSQNYGTTASGVCAIDWAVPGASGSVDFGKLDFGTSALKSVPAIHLGVASVTPIRLVITTPDSTEYEYFARGASEELRVQRVDPGKGLRANWLRIALGGETLGPSFTLASVSFMVAESKRRIQS